MSVVQELRAYLIAQAVVQTNDHTVAAPSTVVPSVWMQMVAPEPRVGENITVTLRDTLLMPAATLQAWIIETYVDVIVRSRSEPAGEFLQRQIAGLIHPNDAHGGKVQWTMGALTVECSTFWRGDQPLPPIDEGAQAGSASGDAVRTWDRVQSFRFSCRRKALAGLPLTP